MSESENLLCKKHLFRLFNTQLKGKLRAEKFLFKPIIHYQDNGDRLENWVENLAWKTRYEQVIISIYLRIMSGC